MKATIVKNDNFETIGFEVYCGNSRVFNWGISAHPQAWVKDISFEQNADKIFEIMRLDTEVKARKNFVSEFFDVAKDNKLLKEGKGVNFRLTKEKLERMETKMVSMIKNLK